MINVGIIGYGKMGKVRHKAINSCKDAKILAIYDPRLKRKNKPFCLNINEIIYNNNIDTVFICTPNYLNQKLTIKCLKNNKNVFCEKPPSFNSQEMKKIIKIEKKYKKLLMYGLNHRHHESVKKMKKLIDSKTYGKILWMRGRYGKSVDQSFYKDWRSKKRLSGGGILIDQGIHMLDLFLYLGENFNKVQATVSNLYWKLDVEDNVFVNLENTKNGLTASLHSTMTQWRHLFSLEVFLEKGYFVLNGLKTSSNSYGDEILTIVQNRSKAPTATYKKKDEQDIHYKNDNSFKSEVNQFFKSIQKNKKILIGSSNNALTLMKLIDKIYKYKK
jgi:predicted dehydrogenase